MRAAVHRQRDPGQLPDQWFDQGGGNTDETSLGWAGGGSAACAQVEPGDELEAYETVFGGPERVQFFRWSAPTGPCSMSGDYSAQEQRNWTGPSTVTDGGFPRLAGGEAGLFLLSGDSVTPGTTQPTAVDVRRYDPSSHSFAAPHRLAVVADQDYSTANGGGGLGESFTTGELAAVWPDVTGDAGLMSLYLSTNAGKRFSSAQDVAQIGYGYGDLDNARVAVAANGTGFVTFQDAGGLHVANLEPLAAEYAKLKLQYPSVLEVPVTCEAPKGTCKASATVTAKRATIASGHRLVPSGQTAILRLPFGGAGPLLLAAAHGRLRATLRLTITHPGAAKDILTVHTLIIR